MSMQSPQPVDSPLKIDIVGASAGTGKTTRLASEFINAVVGSDNKKPVDASKIIVCTFTKKAADEIAARIRRSLLLQGRVDDAQTVLSGYVGTINSICGRLLKDFALECGLSPRQEVISEQMHSGLFSIATASVVDSFSRDIDDIARRLSFNEASKKTRFQRRTHWMEHVRTITNLARANGLTSDDLKASASRSWQGMKLHFGAPFGFDPDELDDLLKAELERVVNGIDSSNDSTEVTAKALQELRSCFARARSGGLTWRDWASLARLEVGTQSKAFVKNLLGAAGAVQHHPQLHEDLERYIDSIFTCAAASLDEYQNYKKANGLVDFVDQEYLTLQLLDNPSVQESLKSRLELVLIDEFQDTSPIQLALFIKLARIADRSIWVGDIKQAIYGFRGTDPQLMQDAALQFNRQTPLGASYRARPELVDFSNEMFKRVFAEHGMLESDVVISPSGKRASSPGHSIETWQCNGETLEECFSAVSVAVRNLLAGKSAREIEDPRSGDMRTLRGSDIAILCRKNDHCSQIAMALSKQGLRVAMTRDGLLDTPECLLTIGALRYLVDPEDKPALATLIHLTRNYDESDQSRWLSDWLAAGSKPEKLLENLSAFKAARSQLAIATIGDAIGMAISLSGVINLCASWGDTASRLSNLDALKGLAMEYEDTCAMARSSVTIQGFLNYLNQLDESERPASVDPEAIHILTYHGAKGLEWPVVVLADLDAGATAKVHKDLCKITVEAASEDFDVSNPLKGRWIRFWPWPFGSIEKDGSFEPSAARSKEFMSASERVLKENARLMYVGITRARDILVLASYAGRHKSDSNTKWLDELCFQGAPVVTFPTTDGTGFIFAGQTKHRAKHSVFNCEPASVAQEVPTASYLPAGPEPSALQLKPKLPYFIQPSGISNFNFAESNSSGWTTKIIDIGQRIQLLAGADMQLVGDCVHSFLACNDLTQSHDEQISTAERIRSLWQATQITNEDLLLMSSRFDSFLKTEFQDYERYDECPVSCRLETSRMRGVIDVLIQTKDGYHIIDHKSFPGPPDQWSAKALLFASQLSAYKFSIEQSTRQPVHRLMIHMPIIGKVLELLNDTVPPLSS